MNKTCLKLITILMISQTSKTQNSMNRNHKFLQILRNYLMEKVNLTLTFKQTKKLCKQPDIQVWKKA